MLRSSTITVQEARMRRMKRALHYATMIIALFLVFTFGIAGYIFYYESTL